VFPIETTKSMGGGGGVNVPVGTTGVSISSSVTGSNSQTFSSWELNELSVMFSRDVENNISQGNRIIN
jgi:hypothetical protein